MQRISEILHLYKLPGDADTAGLQSALWIAEI